TGADTAFNAQGVVVIAGVALYIGARYDGEGAGWTFQGGFQPGSALPIGALVQDLADRFKVPGTLPAPVAGLTIDALDVRFNTIRRDFCFGGGASFPLDAGPARLAMTFDLTHPGGGYARRLGGQLTLGGKEFSLSFLQDSQAGPAG